ncbi:hypothetical protein [Brachyspira pilosicoli]|uniref:hypothetical protein n=1 Tax=Brachyspira pilosicoli TaxID=52584 RepID=UPI003007E1CA
MKKVIKYLLIIKNIVTKLINLEEDYAMEDTFILFDNTKGNESIGKIKGSYDDVLIGYMTLIYQTAIKTNKKSEDVVLDILYKVKDNKETLYKYMKKKKVNKK